MVYFNLGLTALSDDEVLELYQGRKLPATYIEPPNPHLHTDARYLILRVLNEIVIEEIFYSG